MLDKAAVDASLRNLFVGDALSMPVHWYYNPGDIVRQFGKLGVQAMQAAPTVHPSSIMSLHSTKTGGRRAIEDRGQSREVVGEVILKGKREFWGQQGVHYHHGMPAGENTLNAWCARELMSYLLKNDGYEVESWAQHYIDFMTSDPARHPDTYAESYHRGYFSNWSAGKNPLKCGAVTHDTPSMGALVTIAPLVVALHRNHTLPEVQRITRQHTALTHPDDGLMKVVDSYVDLLIKLFEQAGACDSAQLLPRVQTAILSTTHISISKLVQQPRGDAAVVGGRFSLACYIDDSWPSVCYLAAKYHTDPRKALTINTNLGGENAHRGAVLGTVVGAASQQVPEDLYGQLVHQKDLTELLKAFIARFVV